MALSKKLLDVVQRTLDDVGGSVKNTGSNPTQNTGTNSSTHVSSSGKTHGGVGGKFGTGTTGAIKGGQLPDRDNRLIQKTADGDIAGRVTGALPKKEHIANKPSAGDKTGATTTPPAKSDTEQIIEDILKNNGQSGGQTAKPSTGYTPSGSLGARPEYRPAETVVPSVPTYTEKEYEKPSKPEYTAPEQKQYEKPSKPEYTAPEQKQYEKPEFTAPEQPSLSRPSFNDPGTYAGEKPTYSGTYTEQIKQLLEEVLGRKGLDYDQSKDPFWRTYKDQYTDMGKQAMRDSMGQAATLTGGYASSYAQAVGQQQYNNYLQQLASRAPELYQMALQKYNADSDNLYKRFEAVKGMDDTEYGRYRDDVSDYWHSVDQANAERSFAASLYQTELGQYNADRSQQNYENETAYNRYRDSVSDYYRQLEYDRYEEEKAYDRYRDQMSDYNNELTQQRYDEQRDYDRYRDAMSDYYNSLTQQRYDEQRDYDRYRDALSDYNNEEQKTYDRWYDSEKLKRDDRNFEYSRAQDALTQKNYEEERDYERRALEEAAKTGGTVNASLSSSDYVNSTAKSILSTATEGGKKFTTLKERGAAYELLSELEKQKTGAEYVDAVRNSLIAAGYREPTADERRMLSVADGAEKAYNDEYRKTVDRLAEESINSIAAKPLAAGNAADAQLEYIYTHTGDTQAFYETCDILSISRDTAFRYLQKKNAAESSGDRH